MQAVAQLQHSRSVNSAHFSPDGSWLVTTGQDDKLHLYDINAITTSISSTKAAAAVPAFKPVRSISHNNQTGRWLTKVTVINVTVL
jgi:WD40 repeat protein